MEGEQLELMRVIQFPKNRIVENQQKMDKVEFACRLLKNLVDDGFDFHIVIDSKAIDKYIGKPDNSKFKYVKREYTILTSDLEKGKILLITPNNTCLYEITGNELN